MAKCFKIKTTQFAKFFTPAQEATESKDLFIWCSDPTDMVKFEQKVLKAFARTVPKSGRDWRQTRSGGLSGHVSLDRAGFITPFISFGRSCTPEMRATALKVLNEHFVR